MRHRAHLLLVFLSLPSLAVGAAPAEPSPQEKLTALATVAAMWKEKKDTPTGPMLATAVSLMVMEAAGVNDPRTPEDQKKIAEVVEKLKASGTDASEPVNQALAQFRAFACRSKQSEARVNLKGLYVAQKSYFAERDTYEKDLHKVGFEPESKRYRIELLAADQQNFSARAVGLDDMAGDEWTISSADGMPQNTKNACAH